MAAPGGHFGQRRMVKLTEECLGILIYSIFYEDFVKLYETVPKNYPDNEPWTYKFDRTEWLFDEMVKEREK